MGAARVNAHASRRAVVGRQDVALPFPSPRGPSEPPGDISTGQVANQKRPALLVRDLNPRRLASRHAQLGGHAQRAKPTGEVPVTVPLGNKGQPSVTACSCTTVGNINPRCATKCGISDVG